MYGLRWLCACCLLVFALGVLPGQESWYLISESELQSIERYKEKSEAERQTWLSQVRDLRIRAEQSAADSKLLNSQLAQAREQQRRSETLFEQLEADQLTLLSLKNGEIVELKQAVADKTLEAERYKRLADTRLVMVIALATCWVICIEVKVCRFFRVIRI